MTPNDRDFGRLEGKVDSIAESMEKLERAVDARLGAVESRTDSLEGTRDEGKGAANMVRVLQGVAVVALPFLGAVIGKGVG